MKNRLLLCLIAHLTASATTAHAMDILDMPYVDKGEWEAEYFGAVSVDSNDEKDNAQKHNLAVAYGITDFWKAELSATFEKEPEDDITFDAWELESIFQFTERGEYWLDSGASLAFEWTPQSNRANKVEARLLLAKDIGQTFHLVNLIAEKDVGSGPREKLEGGFIWSSRYNYNIAFQPGFEINSDFGELSDTGEFDEQSHYVGPAAYGTLPVPFSDEEGEGLGYRIGYLFGVSDAAADGQAIIQLEYEIEF